MNRAMDRASFPDTALNEEALTAYMKKLAAEYKPCDRARLRRSTKLPVRLRHLGMKASQVLSGTAAHSPAIEWLTDNIRWAAVYARDIQPQRGIRLPARSGVTRIETICQALVSHSDGKVSRERLVKALTAFDSIQGLEMDEIWLAPEALRKALLALFVRMGNEAVRDQAAREEAENWVRHGSDISRIPRQADSVFYEHALKILNEGDACEERSALEKWLSERTDGCDTVIHHAHERDAVILMALSGAAGSLRALSSFDWKASFAAVCRVEKALAEDPVYPNMDEQSRKIIRDQVRLIARRTGLAEWTVARHAVLAASRGSDEKGTCCWYLYDDDGRRSLMDTLGFPNVRLPRLIPDPDGKKLMTGYVLAIAGVLFVLRCLTGAWYLTVLLIPVAWKCGIAAADAAAARLVRPAALLKMQYQYLPDEARTLVTLPVLLTDREQTDKMIGKLESLGALNQDKNVEYLLLGDYADAPDVNMPGDADILRAGQEGIAKINARCRRSQYHFLLRGRTLSENDHLYMGRERKRGALEDLNRLLLTGESMFLSDCDCDSLRHGNFSYVLTLDADTRMLPDVLYDLVGAACHPVNKPRMQNGRRKGWAILFPRVELSLGNRFVQLLGGINGVDSYAFSVSNTCQDLCGRSMFGGKGLYHVAAFSRALSGRIPQNTVLSHDLLEGALAGAALVNDVTVFDEFPASYAGYLRRLNRWTRGDWQLLPFLKRKSNVDGLGRFMMVCNLFTSLCAPCQLILLMVSLWTGRPGGVFAALLPCFFFVLTGFPHLSGHQLRQAAARLASLPGEAFYQADAIVRAVYRMTVSHQKMLQWTPASQADTEASHPETVLGHVLSVSLVPVLFRHGWTVFVLGISLVLFAGSSWLASLKAQNPQPPLTDDQRQILMRLAERTWRFFAKYVPLESPGLPPDNVQLDPPTGETRRTSPTNIGLYLASCTAARMLGLIGEKELTARMEACTETLEKLPKWKGHLYNWYDLDTLSALSPRYVSSVDSGNLAACLMLAAGAVPHSLFQRMTALARAMDFSALYDVNRDLFFIGYDAENGRLSDARYDLLASESRILSYTAIALGQVPVRHWFALSRPRTGRALISWSGTLFEYLMPELFMPFPAQSLVGESSQAVVSLQAQAHPDAWGVSESGYYAFDLQMCYQYRAFGLERLSLRGGSYDNVIAPYAGILALNVNRVMAFKNMDNMMRSGWVGQMGFYEAVDMDPARLPEGVDSRIVKSHMAHHQGMILCSIANALTDGGLQHLYMARPEMRCISLLLEEKPLPPARETMKSHKSTFTVRSLQRRRGRTGHPLSGIPDSHLLHGGPATCFITAAGESFYKAQGIMANRFRAGLFPDDPDGLFVHVKVDGQHMHLSQQVHFYEGGAGFQSSLNRVQAQLAFSVSPEDGMLDQCLTLHNQGPLPSEIEVTGCFAVAACSMSDYEAHPSFQNLFLSATVPQPGAIAFVRMPRRREEKEAALLYKVTGDANADYSFGTDASLLTDRQGHLGTPADLASELSGRSGPSPTPCAALRARFMIAPGAKKEIVFSLALCDADEIPQLLLKMGCEHARRAGELAASQARAMLDFLSIDDTMHHLLQRASALLIYPGLRPVRDAKENRPCTAFSPAGLWPFGISGDHPMISVFVGSEEHLPLAREAARAHRFYLAMGLTCDLIMIHDCSNDYMQATRDELRRLTEESGIGSADNPNRHAFLIDGALLTSAQRFGLLNCARICLIGSNGSLKAQLSRMLRCAQASPHARQSMELSTVHVSDQLHGFNGYGGFSSDYQAYRVLFKPGKLPPAAWCNILAAPDFGAMVSERGGMFLWSGSSYTGRLTAWSGDPLWEGFPLHITVIDQAAGTAAGIIPLSPPAQALHGQGYTVFHGMAQNILWTAALYVPHDQTCLHIDIEVTNRQHDCAQLRLEASCDFLMGTGVRDKAYERTWFEDGLMLSRGAMPGVGYLSFPGSERAENKLCKNITVPPETVWQETLLLGWAAQEQAAFSAAKDPADSSLSSAKAWWNRTLSRIEFRLPDEKLSAMLSRFLPYQALAGRVFARTGLYQAGGAWGFRDQLQDVLCLMPLMPQLTRSHLLTCAARQFEAGDVLHWWHDPARGVRTRISDDLLYLPYVTALYVRHTGDSDILEENIPFLSDMPVDPDKDDLYADMKAGNVSATLYEHCMRAIRRASSTGPNGLALMGSGDWNDGMNRVKGESVWLSAFLAVTAKLFARACASGEDRISLLALSESSLAAVEKSGWNGRWYRRAYYEDGTPMGDAGCRIDMIAQGWAVAAGVKRSRALSAMNEAWNQLVDERLDIVKLFTPPFDRTGRDPGYIAAYPAGVRENGGQYTHGACWGVMGWARLGQADRAWRAFEMLLPTSHTRSHEAVMRYRLEPYAAAADIYGEPPMAGRGGWSWYTGAAGWLYRIALCELMGFERRKNHVRLRALLPEKWNEASIVVREGKSEYTLTARRDVREVSLDGQVRADDWIELDDDGHCHQAVFPALISQKQDALDTVTEHLL